MSSAASILSAFQKDSIIPDIIPASEKFNPSVFLSVIPPVKSDAFINGAEVPREETLGQPEIVFTAADPTKTYTVVMTDPDVPSRADPKLGEFRHWLVRATIRFFDVPSQRRVHVDHRLEDCRQSSSEQGDQNQTFIYLLFPSQPPCRFWLAQIR